MATRLKLTSKRIPWSLAAKAALFGGGWFLLPLPLFFILALYLYAFPIFNVISFALVFTVTLGLAGVAAKSIISAAYLAMLFFLIIYFSSNDV